MWVIYMLQLLLWLLEESPCRETPVSRPSMWGESFVTTQTDARHRAYAKVIDVMLF
jgi:hypothetical protein